MPASAVITLDTAPPALSLGEPQRPDIDRIVVPYELSEDGFITEAKLVLEEGQYDLAVFPGYVEGFIPVTHQQTAYVYVRAQDDVWNEVIRSVTFVVTGPIADLAARILKNPRLDGWIAQNPVITVKEKKNPRIEGRVE